MAHVQNMHVCMFYAVRIVDIRPPWAREVDAMVAFL